MDPIVRDIEVPVSDNGGYGKRTGIRTVKAGAFGYVAVHVPVTEFDGNESQRTVTHLGTCMAIATGLSRDVAIRLAEILGSDPLWDFTTLDQFAKRKDALQAKLRAAMKRATAPARKEAVARTG